MRRLITLAPLVLAACYAPHPPSGAYSCTVADPGGCPDGQSCECGLCVKNKNDAACAFRLTLDGNAADITVDEHQSFKLTIQALDAQKNPSASFSGTVRLASSWGDVSPSEVTLKNGQVVAEVALNRETLRPAVALVTASFGDKNKGVSPKINVTAPKLVVDPSWSITPPFGWSTLSIAQPNVVRKGATSYLYFYGRSVMATGVGLATSTDGVTFTASGNAPLLAADVQSPAVYFRGDKTYLAFDTALSGLTTSAISIATADAPTGPFQRMGMGSVITPSECAYCGRGVSFPQVIEDSTQEPDESGNRPLLMFFAATRADGLVALGRASSADGLNWTPEPAPLLSSDVTDEALLISPRVLIDGHVFKMWYSFARLRALAIKACSATNPCAAPLSCVNGQCINPNDTLEFFCDPATRVEIGYATSDDGYFWSRSPSNPVLSVDAVPGNVRSVLVGSAHPADGINGSSGIVIEYSPFNRTVLGKCNPAGLGRATRP